MSGAPRLAARGSGPPGPPVRPKAVVSWSSGKDSAFALHVALRSGEFDIVGLLTTLAAPYSRVSMHGVREAILERQAAEAGLPLHRVALPVPCPNAVYEERMGTEVRRLRGEGVERILFGDLFLRDIRSYREEKLRGTGIDPVFPLWGRPTDRLAREMIASGLRARIVALDPLRLPASLAGRPFDEALLADLPAGVDPCGENGEFHTCVTEGPMFRHAIPVDPGRVVERDGFVFADLLLREPSGRGAGPSTPPHSSETSERR